MYARLLPRIRLSNDPETRDNTDRLLFLKAAFMPILKRFPTLCEFEANGAFR